MKKKCATCEAMSFETQIVSEYNADLLGAPFGVVLCDGVEITRCSQCGTILKTLIPDLSGFLRVIAETRALHPRLLTGSEIKFLRKSVDCKAKALARKIEMTPENLSRVENGMKPLGPQSEKLLRFYVLSRVLDDDVAIGLLDEKTASKKRKEYMDCIFNMKIKAVWNQSEPLVFYFVRENVDESEEGPRSDEEKKHQARYKAAAA
jgi:transcriptional regulator with XRE-family HTH domain